MRPFISLILLFNLFCDQVVFAQDEEEQNIIQTFLTECNEGNGESCRGAAWYYSLQLQRFRHEFSKLDLDTEKNQLLEDNKSQKFMENHGFLYSQGCDLGHGMSCLILGDLAQGFTTFDGPKPVRLHYYIKACNYGVEEACKLVEQTCINENNRPNKMKQLVEALHSNTSIFNFELTDPNVQKEFKIQPYCRKAQ